MRVVTVLDGFGSIMGICVVGSKAQTELAVSSACEEWFEHCRGDVFFSDDEWDFIQMNAMDNVSIPIITGAGDEIEISTKQLRDFTHYNV